jgi:hypothetical protein
MASDRARTRIERLVWILLYGGLFGVVLGLATTKYDPLAGWALLVAGGALAIGGVVLIWVRSRVGDE